MADEMRRRPGYERDPGRLVLLGAADDPANQRQHASVADLESGGGLLVLGTGGSGKTTVLRTAAASAALDDQRAGGSTVAIFVLDFSSGELRSLTRPCRSAAASARSTTWRPRPGSSRRSTWRSGRRRAAVDGTGAEGDDPTVLLLVDGYANLVDALQNTRGGQEQTSDQWLSAFHRIVLDGRQLGVHSLLTADRAASVRNAVFAGVTRRLVLRQVDVAETKSLGVPATQSLPPGAGYLDGLRVQVATITPPGVADDAALRAFAEIIDVARLPSLLAYRRCPPTRGGPRRAETAGRWHGLVGDGRHHHGAGAVRPDEPRRARHRTTDLREVLGPARPRRAARGR